MERDLDDIYRELNETAPTPALQQPVQPEAKEPGTAATTPSIDMWAEQPTTRLPGVQLPRWPAPDEHSDGLWQRIQHASRKAQLGLIFGSLFFLFFFAVLIAGALSSGGVLQLPGTNTPLGPSIQIWPSAQGTPTPRLIPQGPGAPTSTPDRAGGTGAGGTGGGPGAPPASPTATNPAGTATPGPTPTATATATPTPTATDTPTPAPTATPTPQPTDTPQPTPTDTPGSGG